MFIHPIDFLFLPFISSPVNRIARMIRQERGNALLVGVGGTGKQSLTRLAAHMCGYRCFQIELSRGYNYDSFHEDLRKLYKMAGVEGQDMVFLFTDTQVHPKRNLPINLLLYFNVREFFCNCVVFLCL